MKTIDEQIDQMSETLEKSTQTPQDKLINVIKSLGRESLKAKLPFLSNDDKIVLKSALEEMNLNKAVSFDKEAQGAKMVQGKVSDTVIQEDKADDDADEKLVKPEAAKFSNQGTPTEGWEGQVIKSQEEIEKAKIGFKKLEGELSKEKGVTNPAGLAAKIGEEKYGKKKFQEAAAEGKKMSKSEIIEQISKSDELMETFVSKMLEKSGDESVVLAKAEKMGMDPTKVKDAMDKIKKKKDKPEEMEKAAKVSKKKAEDEIMEMEEKEHKTKDPKKLVEAEKKEQGLEKGKTKILQEEDQLGDAPEMNEKTMGKKEAAPNVTDVPKASKDAQKDVKNLKVKKALTWESDNRLLKANTLGRNFNFNLEHFVTETLKNPKAEQTIQKSETMDVNDLIEKSMDTTWGDLDVARIHQDNINKQNGRLVKSFEDNEIAQALGLTEEEAKKILG